MLTLNYRYRIYPDATQQQTLVEWMETCRVAYNYALREIKDWCDSRKCAIDRCSLEREYILAADLKFPTEVNQLNSLPKAKKEFPRLGEVPSQVLQQTIKQLHRGWEYFQERRFGFPRFKKYGQFKSLLFPQFQSSPVTGIHLRLPKLGAIPINLHRSIQYVCWKRGKFFDVVDARGTSQECPECGAEARKNLSVRVHHCPNCDYTTDRDVAAGQNIRNRGIKASASLRLRRELSRTL